MKEKSNIHLFLLPVVFFLCIPALFVKQNIQDIARLDFEVIVVLFSLAFVSVFLLLSANALFGKNQLKDLLGSFSEFVCFFVIATGFVFPTSISTGMMDPEIVLLYFYGKLRAVVRPNADDVTPSSENSKYANTRNSNKFNSSNRIYCSCTYN